MAGYNKFGNIKTKVDGITFDSKMEAKFYAFVKELKESGQIADFKMQTRYEIFPAFKKDGKTHRKIEYKSDFDIIHHDGRIEIIDVKGVETDVFKIKRKLFESRYYDLTIKCITWSKIDGGWVELEKVKAGRKQRKATKK